MTLIELIWTITPALVLIAIAFPSFRLLYLLDYESTINFVFYSIPIVNILKRTNPKPNGDSNANIRAKAVNRTVLVSIKKIRSECTAIVQYGSVSSSTLGIRLNHHCRIITKLFSPKREQIIGHLLGDGTIAYAWSSVTPYFKFSQSMFKFYYF